MGGEGLPRSVNEIIMNRSTKKPGMHSLAFLYVLRQSLPNKIRCNPVFRLRMSLPTCGDVFQHPGHIVAQGAHGLQALQILHHIFGTVPMNAVPILRGHNGHLIDGEV